MNNIPSGHHIVEFLAARQEFVGIGKMTARRLWSRFGTELYKILAGGDPAELSEVLDWNRAAILIDAWQLQQSLVDCVVFFEEQGLDPGVARKAVKFWGENAVAKIRENPYRLLTVCPWSKIDLSAIRLGVDPSDPRRLVAAVESILYERLDRKHTWTSKAALTTAIAKRLQVSSVDAGNAIAIAEADGAAIDIDGGYQPAGAAYMERFIEMRVLHHMQDIAASDLFLDSISLADIDSFASDFSRSNALTEEQLGAVRMALRSTFSLLVGGAGVGKTTVLKAITAAAHHFGMTVYQLAVAGRAANRIAEATGHRAQTVASWIQGVANGKIEVGRHTFVIIDEASMLDLPTLFRILFHLPSDAPMLLVGDTAQLPPIGFGLTLHKLVSEQRIPTKVLTKILRASEESGIPAVSRSIRKGVVPSLPDYIPGLPGCSFVSAEEERITHALEDIVHDLEGVKVQIVAATYRGDAGIGAINSHFHDLNAGTGSPSRHRFAVGDPCIWTVNDYERGLWNGSMGRVVQVEEHAVFAEFAGRRHEVLLPELDNLDLAYCISVHKAQGSQFGTVIVPVVRSLNFDRALLYTAATRAIDRVVLIGSMDVLDGAIRDYPFSLNREVGLRLRDLTAKRVDL